ncbi:hypothetical protein MYP_2575 [Sporocytophaga myxococcoides]|uniref:Uncharacterized protein n=1 Tax=Sporocytophaga myxococcoides TaxID=153721 RepID=A0A098LEK9_9BACT|nr:hypothetical protein [Sporocytophaga myxococcoides]GAL85346.1 hypothetical protein MYP_2575 [Sporocytophaga myxococcoides]
MSKLRASFEKIDEYLNGELSRQELSEFKVMMEKHESLAEEVQLQQLANEAIVELNLTGLRKDLKRISLKQRTASRYKLYGGTATAIILISVIAYFTISPKANELKAEYTDHTKPVSEESPISLNAKVPESIAATPQPLISEITTQKPPYIESQIPLPATSELQSISDSIMPLPETITQLNSINLAIEQMTEHVQEKYTIQSSPVPCKADAIDAFIHIEPVCKDQKGSGKITIDLASVKGGKPGYQFSLNGGANYQEFPVFEDLGFGPAQLLIKDSQGCISRKQLIIPEKNCFKEIILYPLRDETWTAPVISKENKIIIADIQGHILFENHYSDTDNFTWNGKTTDGQDLPVGQYYYTIKGSIGNVIHGYISILR